MKKYTVTDKNGTISYFSETPLDFTAMGHGKPERWEDGLIDGALETRTVIDRPASPEVLDENNNVVQEAQEEISHVESKLPAEYTVEVIDITVEVENARITKEALEYLKSTDWYIIREMDSGVPCPQEIKDARALARTKI